MTELIPGFAPRFQSTANAGASGMVDSGDKHRDEGIGFRRFADDRKDSKVAPSVHSQTSGPGMLSDDNFRKRLQHVISALEVWAAEMEPWADIELGFIDSAWRISAAPHAETACAFEIILRPDQKFDMRVGGETYEDQPLDALTDVPQLVRAIANGRILIRCWESWTTGLKYNVETIVDLPGADEGRFEKPSPAAPPVEDAELMARLRTFAPYRR